MVTDFDVVVYMLAMMVLSGAVGWLVFIPGLPIYC